MAENLREIKTNQAAGWLWHKRGSVTLHFNRTPTPEELAAIAARQAQEHADTPNREADAALVAPFRVDRPHARAHMCGGSTGIRATSAARVRKAIARYPLAWADAGCRRNHLSAQIALLIKLPRRRAA